VNVPAKAEVDDDFYLPSHRWSMLGGVSPEAFERASILGCGLPTIPWEVHLASLVAPLMEAEGFGSISLLVRIRAFAAGERAAFSEAQ
jgi:hypothetical protein